MDRPRSKQSGFRGPEDREFERRRRGGLSSVHEILLVLVDETTFYESRRGEWKRGSWTLLIEMGIRGEGGGRFRSTQSTDAK